jgi:hypothetical protein
MQSDPQPLDPAPSSTTPCPTTPGPANPSPPAFSSQVSVHPHTSLAPCEAASTPPTYTPPAYTPRTVWQTPHGLAPTFSTRRGARHPSSDPVAALLRRCLRLTYRLRRVLAEQSAPSSGGWAQRPSTLAS